MYIMRCEEVVSTNFKKKKKIVHVDSECDFTFYTYLRVRTCCLHIYYYNNYLYNNSVIKPYIDNKILFFDDGRRDAYIGYKTRTKLRRVISLFPSTLGY